MRTTRVALVGAVTLTTLWWGQAASATHVPGHRYSTVAELHASGNHTGVRVQRWDENISAGGPCDGNPLTSPVIFQSMWEAINPNPFNDWIELGTAHKTANCKYWYWGYASNFNFTLIGVSGNVGLALHTFQIVRGPTGDTWLYKIDVTTLYEAPIYYQRLGFKSEVGLEGYSVWAPLFRHTPT